MRTVFVWANQNELFFTASRKLRNRRPITLGQSGRRSEAERFPQARRTLYCEYNVPVKVGMSLSLLTSAGEMSDRQSEKRSWFSYKGSYNVQSGPGHESQLFRRSACFLSDNGRCMLPRLRHKASTLAVRRKAPEVRRNE
jgi:hypothetical protein